MHGRRVERAGEYNSCRRALMCILLLRRSAATASNRSSVFGWYHLGRCRTRRAGRPVAHL